MTTHLVLSSSPPRMASIMLASSNVNRLQREKANLHPGRIILETQTKWHTPAQKKADDLHAQEVIDAQAAAIQQAHA